MYNFCRLLFSFLIKIVYNVHFDGAENVPDKGVYILASNHHSYIDPVLLSLCVKKRRVHWMAKIELFKNKFVAKWLESCGAFAVDRGAGDTGAITKSVELLRINEILGIFPEGTRSKTGKTARAKSGISRIAREAKCDILPCCVYYKGHLRFRTRIVVCYGKLIPYQDLNLDVEKPDYRSASDYVMSCINTLLENQED